MRAAIRSAFRSATRTAFRGGDVKSSFIMVWRTTGASESVTLPATGTNNFTVDWGDATVETVTTASPSHVYAVADDYTVTITGSCSAWAQDGVGDRLKIIDVTQWGDVGFTDLSGAFNGCSNLTVSANDAGAFGSVTNMSAMFLSAIIANPNVSAWDVSSVTNMGNMFRSASAANPNVSSWDVSSATSMASMFKSATAANPNVASWDVSSVTLMNGMFQSATIANPDVSSFDVSLVTDMTSMFSASAFSNVNYDLLLAAWSLLTLKSSVPFHAGTAQYTEVAARAVLTGTYLWVITDGGPA